MSDDFDVQERDRNEMTEPEPIEERELEVPLFPMTEVVTGPAGTGKTFLMRERAEKHSGVVLCATTGIAAVNLGEGVTTINSLIGFFDTASLRDMWTQGWLASKLMQLWKAGLRQIVLDEMSMMDGEQLLILTAALDELRGRLEGQGGGGIGLTLTGDFCQLPPIKAPFAFEVDRDVWGRYEGNLLKLTEMRRQSDPGFLAALSASRRGDGAGATDFFSPAFALSQDPDYPGVTLLAKNAEVDRFNLLRMMKLHGEKVSWTASRWGKERPEWRLIPDVLHLKIGTLVMILANQREYDDDGSPTGRYLYVNGDLGELVEVTSGAAFVRLRRGERVRQVSMIQRSCLQPLEPGRRKELRAAGEDWKIVCTKMGCRACRDSPGRCPSAKHEIIGQVSYMPLRVAYATTVHKSQGLTLDNAQIDFRDHFFEAPGMVYVALSRVRAPKGLRLVGRPETFIKRCKTSPKVAPWV